jgi:anti-sigma factor RsiW
MSQSAPCEGTLRDLHRVLGRNAHSRDCEGMRASISASLDGELSELESTRMRAHAEECASCKAFQAHAETIAAALRTAPRERPNGGRSRNGEAVRSSLRLVTPQPAAARSARTRTGEATHELKLSLAELALIYKSLRAAKTLGALPPQDELLDDTIQRVDQALKQGI